MLGVTRSGLKLKIDSRIGRHRKSASILMKIVKTSGPVLGEKVERSGHSLSTNLQECSILKTELQC
jgi:hypothetical protein